MDILISQFNRNDSNTSDEPCRLRYRCANRKAEQGVSGSFQIENESFEN